MGIPAGDDWKSVTACRRAEREGRYIDFWLRDESLGDLDKLPKPDDNAEEIIENLESGLESFRNVLAYLQR